MKERGISELPTSLKEAVTAFTEDPFTKQTLGDTLHSEFVTYKSEEWRQYHQSISQWEVDRYARLY